MQPTCDSCGRPLRAAGAAPGARGEATCSCAPAVVAAPDAPERGARDAGPLPAPREGNLEVDPWSLPAPEDGYENLTIDDAPAAESAPAEAPAAADPPAAAPDEAAAPDIASSVAARADAEQVPEPAARSRSAILAAAAVAVLVVAGIAIVFLARGRSSAATSASGAVRVTVTQEVHRDEAPPLAPIDPSYVERTRPAVLSVRPAAAAARPSAGARPARGAPSASSSAVAPAAPGAEPEPPPPSPEPAPAAAAPEPPPAEAPRAPPTAADIPLPPPPVLASPQPASAATPRAPVLQTRSCVTDALRLPRGLEGSLPAEVVLRVDVAEDGSAANVSFPGHVDPRLRAALVAAVRTCRFAPGADASGRPAAAATTMRLRFE